MTGPRVDVAPGVPHIPTLAEFDQQQYLTGPARQRAMTDTAQATAKVPALSRIPTLDEFDQMRGMTGPGIKALQIPALPPIPAAPKDAVSSIDPAKTGTTYSAHANRIIKEWAPKIAAAGEQATLKTLGGVVGPGGELALKTGAKALDQWATAAEKATKPDTWSGELVRNVASPVMHHPWMTGGMIGAAMIPVVGPVVASAMAGDMASNAALYGYQTHLENTATPDVRKEMEADPERISGKAAIIQATMLGLLPALHYGFKAAGGIDVGGGMMEAGAKGLSELKPTAGDPAALDTYMETYATKRFAARLAAGVKRQGSPRNVAPIEGLQSSTKDAAKLTTVPRTVKGLETPLEVKAGRVKLLETEPLAATAEARAEQHASLVEARRAYEAERLVQDQADLSAARTAEADKIAKADAMRPRRRAIEALFNSDAIGETLGAAAAQHGLPADASPFPPETPLDTQWRNGYATATGAYPEGFSIGGESRIPAATEIPKQARGRNPYTAKAPTGGASADDAAHLAAQVPPGDPGIAVEPGQDGVITVTSRGPDGKGNGALVLHPNAEGGHDVYTVHVAVESRRQGIATALYDAADKAGLNVRSGQMGLSPEGEAFTQARAASSGELAPVAGTGETKTRGLSLGVEEKALANKLTNTLGDLPEYRTVNMAEQAALAGDLLASDPALARRVALGEVPAPDNLLPESVFVAVENKAIADGDVATIHDLASGKLTEQATTMGQRVRALGERDPDSPVSAIQRIEETRGGGPSTKAFAREVRSIEAHLAKMDVAWKSFVDGMRC